MGACPCENACSISIVLPTVSYLNESDKVGCPEGEASLPHDFGRSRGQPRPRIRRGKNLNYLGVRYHQENLGGSRIRAPLSESKKKEEVQTYDSTLGDWSLNVDRQAPVHRNHRVDDSGNQGCRLTEGDRRPSVKLTANATFNTETLELPRRLVRPTPWK